MFAIYTQSISWWAILVIKSIVLLGLALFIHRIMKNKPAAFRHSFLTLVLFSLLLMPLIALLPSSLHLGFLDAKPGLSGHTIQPVNADSFFLSPDNYQVASREIESPVRKNEISPNSSHDGIWKRLMNYIPIAWIVVFLLFIQRIFAALCHIRSMSNHGREISGNFTDRVIAEFSRRYAMNHTVLIRENPSITIPFTWGIRRPVILLPQGSAHWPENKRFSILFHELSHIHRNDFLLNLLSFLVSALFWFNPLVWIVFCRIKEDQEKACDEMVLSSGIKPSSYAAYLLDMKKHFGKQRLLRTAVIGLASKRRFPERLMNILHHQNQSKEAKMKHKIMWFGVLFLALFLVGTANPYKTDHSLISSKDLQEQEKKEEKELTVRKEKKEKLQKSDSTEPAQEKLILKKREKTFVVSAPGGMTLDADGKIYSDFLSLTIAKDKNPPYVIVKNNDGTQAKIIADRITLKSKSGNGPHIIIRKEKDGKMYELKAENMKFSIRGEKEGNWFSSELDGGDESKWVILKSGDRKAKDGDKNEEILVWTQKKSGPKELAIVTEKGNYKELVELYEKGDKRRLKEEEIKKLLGECRQSLNEIKEAELRKKISDKLEALEKTLGKKDKKALNEFFVKVPSEDSEKTIDIFIDSAADAAEKDIILISDKAELIDIDDSDFSHEPGDKIIYIFSKRLDDSQIKRISDLIENLKSKLPQNCRIKTKLEKEQGRIVFIHTPDSNTSSTMDSDTRKAIRDLTQPLKEILGSEAGNLMILHMTEKKK